MPTILRNLKVKRVAFVDEGANPDAHIRFAKSKDGDAAQTGEPDMTAEERESLFKRFFSAVAKAFGVEPDDVAKDAHTFGDIEAARNYDMVLEKEYYPMICAMNDSIRSILFDNDQSQEGKEALLKQSLSEFSAAFTKAAASWAKGLEADALVSKSLDVIERTRDDLNALIEKSGGCHDGKKVNKEDGDPDDGQPSDPTEQDDGAKKPPVKKGATDMKFNTDAMTPEELAQYEDLAKRFGSEEPEENAAGAAPAANPAPTTDPEQNPANGDDVSKGVSPEIKAELESLRKFREDFELRQYTEIAKKYTLLGKKPEELAKSLKSLKDAGGTAYDDMIALLDANLSAVEASGTFAEIGKRGTSAGAADDAWGKLMTAADEIQKAKPDMRRADAIDQACLQHPELVSEYEKARG